MLRAAGGRSQEEGRARLVYFRTPQYPPPRKPAAQHGGFSAREPVHVPEGPLLCVFRAARC